MLAQVQPLQYRDIVQIQGLNLNGTRRSIYLWGDVEAILRINAAGGDLITFPSALGRLPAGAVFLIALAAETFSNDNWCRVIATLQNSF
jgi:hypothetical protein